MQPDKKSRHEAARIGARARWKDHQPRVIRLDGLTPDQRRLVLAAIEMFRATEARTQATIEAA